ncbi:glycosyltransferase family 25 protein [Teredinibacter haidensis]|uniref:glycosyltransferase family 25 protein n=1 Tax=Teredinibacter haidensis TaxID=2731755 RepID=UPI000948E5CB|nr:glycosyltransferase family 25 protein [Teredinibacter haidensis]
MQQNEKVSDNLLDIMRIRTDNNLDTPAELQSRIMNAIYSDNIKIFKNENGDPIGYVAWARVKRETLNYLTKVQSLPSFSYEWREGRIKLFFDLVLSYEWRRQARDCFNLFLREHRFFAYYRKNRLKICMHTYSRASGYFWHYKLVNPKRKKIFKSCLGMSSKSSNVTYIKYINMDKDVEKRFLISKLLSKFPYASQRIQGVMVNDQNISIENYLKFGFQSYLKKLPVNRQNGVLGCWIAHIKALESITETDGITVVLEDDFVCKEGFFEKALKMIKEFDKDFDVIVFDPSGGGPLDRHSIGSDMYDVDGYSSPEYVGSHCLFYNNKSVKRILKTILSSFVTDFDGFLFKDQTINSYVFYTGESCSIYYYSDTCGIGDQTSLWYGIANWIDFVCDWKSDVEKMA